MRISRNLISNNTNHVIKEDIDLSLIDSLINKYKGKKGNIIPLLQGTQAVYGYIPKVAFDKLSHETGVEVSDMYGVVTFYAQFRLTPIGKYVIKVCHGTACHVQNASLVTDALIDYLQIKDGETTEDRLFTLETVACLGCCSLAPVIMIGNETYGKLNDKKTVNVIKEIQRKEKTNAN